MNTPTPRPAVQRPSAPQGSESQTEDAFRVPPVVKDSPEGKDVSDQPGAEAGHYGPGYGDPTRHLGGSPPGEGRSGAAGPKPAPAAEVDPQRDPSARREDGRREHPGGGQQ